MHHDIIHKSGKSNFIADALSRNACVSQIKSNNATIRTDNEELIKKTEIKDEIEQRKKLVIAHHIDLGTQAHLPFTKV